MIPPTVAKVYLSTPLKEFGIESKEKVTPSNNYHKDLSFLLDQYERIDNKINLLMVQIDKLQDNIDILYSLVTGNGETR